MVLGMIFYFQEGDATDLYADLCRRPHSREVATNSKLRHNSFSQACESVTWMLLGEFDLLHMTPSFQAVTHIVDR